MISSSNSSLHRISEDADSDLILPEERKLILPDLVMLGGAGVGKGTKANLLKEHFGYVHLEMGERLREIVATGSARGRLIDWYQSKGRKAPDLIVRKVMADGVNEVGADSPIVFDGVVRSPEQKRMLDMLREQTNRYNPIKAILLQVDRDEAERRMRQRGRPDDLKPDVRKQRLDIFFSETMRAVDQFGEEGNLTIIDAMGSKEEVNEKFLNALGLRIKQTRNEVKDLMSA